MTRPWDAFAWWEIRRVPFNLIVLVAGVVTLFAIEIVGARLAGVGPEIMASPLFVAAVLAYAVAANVCYTLGWVTEMLWSGGDTTRTELHRGRIFWLGTGFSVLVTLVPMFLFPLLWAIFVK
ncbi:MAG: hypothetical protein ACREHE_13605 [Rhizomicrobium sp.]